MDQLKVLLTRSELVRALRCRQEAALLVDHGDLSRLEVWNTGGDEVLNRLNLLLLEPATLLELHEHRGARRVAVAHEGGLVRYGDVDAGAIDGTQARDGVRELGLKGMLVAGVLHELADPEARLLRHEREAAIAFGQPLSRELQARLAQTLARHLNAVRARLHAIGDAGCIERLGDLRLILVAELGVKETECGAARPQHDAHARGDRSCDANEQK